MAETEKATINPQVPEAPHSETNAAEVAHTTERASDTLAGIQAAASLKTSGLSKDESLILKKGVHVRKPRA